MSGVRSLGTATALAAWRGWFAMPPIRASLPGFAPRRLGAGVPIDAAACRRKLAGVRAHPCTHASSATALAVVLYAKIRVQYRYGTVPARSVWDSPGQRALCAHTAFPKPVGGRGFAASMLAVRNWTIRHSVTLATGIPTSCKPDGHPSPSPREPHRRRNYAVRG